MPYGKCPKCGNENPLETITDGVAVTCSKCGIMYKAHLYRISKVSKGPMEATAITGINEE